MLCRNKKYKEILKIISENDLRKIKGIFKKDFTMDKMHLTSGEDVNKKAEEYMEGLNNILKKMPNSNSKVIANKLRNQPLETLTELVIAGILKRGNQKNLTFERKYRYDQTQNEKDLDISTKLFGKEFLFEMVTRRELKGEILGITGIDSRYLIVIQRKYSEKKIDEAIKNNYLSSKTPIIFVINTERDVPQVFMKNAQKIIGNCKNLSAVIMFSGFKLYDRKLYLNQSQIYFIEWAHNKLNIKEQEKLKSLFKKNSFF